MQIIRLRFKKISDAIYISHLDLLRLFTRAIRRANINAWHTQGFNKHIYLNIPLPLPLGYSALREILDFKSEEEIDCLTVKTLLNQTLPSSVAIDDAYVAKTKASEISFATYIVTLNISKEAIKLAADKLLSQEKIEVVKTNKNGESLIDLTGKISLKVKNEGLEIISPAGVLLNIRPELIIDKLKQYIKLSDNIKILSITRADLLNQNHQPFI